MKIGNPLDKSVGGVSPRSEGASSSGKSSSTSSTSGDSSKVTLSNAAVGLMGADGDIDVQKVSSVKQAIDNGTYKINPEVIADKLIANARDVLARQG